MSAMIDIASSGTVDISRSLFIGIFSVRPADIRWSRTGSTSNSTFYDNAVNSGYSGAVFGAGNGTLTILDSTFLHNHTVNLNGGAIYNGGYPASHVVVRNTIIDAMGLHRCHVPVLRTHHRRRRQHRHWIELRILTTASYQGIPSGLDSTGPKDNGGPTQTIALLPGSAAIDKADPALRRGACLASINGARSVPSTATATARRPATSAHSRSSPAMESHALRTPSAGARTASTRSVATPDAAVETRPTVRHAASPPVRAWQAPAVQSATAIRTSRAEMRIQPTYCCIPVPCAGIWLAKRILSPG